MRLAPDGHKRLVELLIALFEDGWRLVELDADEVGKESSQLVAAVFGLWKVVQIDRVVGILFWRGLHFG